MGKKINVFIPLTTRGGGDLYDICLLRSESVGTLLKDIYAYLQSNQHKINPRICIIKMQRIFFSQCHRLNKT